MSTEEKARAYDEAVKIARCWLNDPQTIQDCNYTIEDAIQNIFPQLRESEDERIRKWLVDYFGSIKETVWIHRDITCAQILEWLEKHKEQKPAWKPSEEQMNCLCAAVDAAIRKHNESVSGYKPARVLKSLYEQLKKL